MKRQFTKKPLYVKCSYEAGASIKRTITRDVREFLTSEGYTVLRCSKEDLADFREMLVTVRIAENTTYEACDALSKRFHPDSCQVSDTSAYNTIYLTWYDED